MLTPTEMAAIEQRAEAATPGPWQVERNHNGLLIGISSPSQMKHDLDFLFTFYARISRRLSQEELNAEFIVHAREDIPKLIAEIKRMQAKIDHYFELLDER